MENTSILRFKIHPNEPKLSYAAVSHIAGFVTEDGGKTFRITKGAGKEARRSLQYDYAFDLSSKNKNMVNVVYAAVANWHDWPDNTSKSLTSEQTSGGVFKSDDRGKSWKRLTHIK
jgi:hypothetical protein